MPAQGYYSDQQYISQQEQFNAFGTAKDLALMSLNPFNWYRYNPNMFSVTRGQVRAPVFGSWWGQKATNLVGKIPGVSKNPFFQGVQRAMQEPQWGGLSPRGWTNPKTGRSGLGLFPFMGRGVEDLGEPVFSGIPTFEVEPIPRSEGGVYLKTVDRRAAGDVRQRIVNELDAERYRKSRGIGVIGRTNKAVRRRAWLNHLFGGPEAQPALTLYGREAERMAGFDALAPKKRSLRQVARATAKEARKVPGKVLRAGAAGGSALVSGVSRAAGSQFVRALGRGAVRGGVAFAKGFAYFELAKLAWDTINMFAEPIGRSMVAQADASLQQFKSIARPELGGSIAMGYMSRGAATERQRALAAISKSQLNARSAMGNEASMLHM